MKKIKSMIVVLLAVVMVAALSGCGGEKAPTGGGAVVGGGDKQGDAPVIGLELIADMEVEPGAEPIELVIPVLAENADNEVLAGFSADIAAKLAAWQAELGEGETMLVKALSLDTQDYLSVVLTKNVAPNYGSDGEVYTYVYDKIVERAMDEDLAMSIGGFNDDLVAEALVDYLAADQKWLSFTLAGYAMAEDGKPVYFIQTDVEQEGADEWTYMYVLKNNEISGNLSALIEDVTNKE